MRRATNQLRALEANIRVGIVILEDLQRSTEKINEQAGVNIDLHYIEACMKHVRNAIDAFHEAAMAYMKENDIPAPTEDDLLLEVQCCGGK